MSHISYDANHTARLGLAHLDTSGIRVTHLNQLSNGFLTLEEAVPIAWSMTTTQGDCSRSCSLRRRPFKRGICSVLK